MSVRFGIGRGVYGKRRPRLAPELAEIESRARSEEGDSRMRRALERPRGSAVALGARRSRRRRHRLRCRRAASTSDKAEKVNLNTADEKTIAGQGRRRQAREGSSDRPTRRGRGLEGQGRRLRQEARPEGPQAERGRRPRGDRPRRRPRVARRLGLPAATVRSASAIRLLGSAERESSPWLARRRSTSTRPRRKSSTRCRRSAGEGAGHRRLPSANGKFAGRGHHEGVGHQGRHVREDQGLIVVKRRDSRRRQEQRRAAPRPHNGLAGALGMRPDRHVRARDLVTFTRRARRRRELLDRR